MSWYQNNVRQYSSLGQTIGKWLIQGVNGLDQSLIGTMTGDLRNLMEPLEDYSVAVSEGQVFAESQQRHPLTWQQQELLQQIMTLNNGQEQPDVMENTGGPIDGMQG